MVPFGVSLGDLWLPILVSAVFVFIASSVIHMVLPLHKSDFQGLPNEEKVLEALRANGVRGGEYMFPKCNSMKDMKSPEMLEKWRKGPVGTMTVLDGMPNIGKNLVQWFLYSIFVGVCAGYVGTLTLPRGAA